MATTSRDMMAIVLHADGGDLKKVTVKPRLHNDLTTVHVVEEKFGKCQGKHGGIEGDDSAVYSIWEREPEKLRSLCGSFVGEAEGVLLLGRAHAGLMWELLLAGNNVLACDDSAKDIAYLTKFVDILVKDERFVCHVEKPRCKHRSNRDMFHKLGRKRLKVWEYLFRDAPQGRLDGNYIYRKAKVTETLKHYHVALTGAFETFVARCEILKFDLHKDQLMSKDYADLAKSGDGFNPVDSEEDSSGSDLESGDGKGGEGPGGGMVRSHDEGTVRSHERPVQVAAPSVGSTVAPMEGTGLPNMGICGPNDEDDIDMPGEASKLAPDDPIPPGYCADPTTIYFLGGKHARTSEDKWGHDIVWHEGIFEPCIQDGEWKMVVKYTRGWQMFRRMSKDTWLKTTELAIMYRVQKENPGKSEGAVKDKAKELFSVLRDNQQLEYSSKFYALRTSPSCESIDWKVNQTIGTMEESSSQDAVPLSASPPVPTQAGQREDDGSNVVKTQEVHMTAMPQISVDTTEPSKRMDVLNSLSSDAGATYGSLLLTSAALEGTSEMQSELGVGLSVPDSQLQPELCTGKGDAQVHLTPQGGAVADGGKGEDVEGILHPHNLETLTDDFDYGVQMTTIDARLCKRGWTVHLATSFLSKRETAALTRIIREYGKRYPIATTHDVYMNEVLQLTRNDLLLLAVECQWLNDNVINFYLNLIALDNWCRIQHVECDAENKIVIREGKGRIPRVSVLSSFLFVKLFDNEMRYRGREVERWCQDVIISDMDLIIAPFHIEHKNHWTLVVADFRRRKFEFYDSLDPDMELARKVTGGFAKFIFERSKSQGKEVDTKPFNHIWNVEGILKQHDTNECGVFVLTYASLLARGQLPPFFFTADDIPAIRRRMALDTVARE
ncbi:hypothetical protein CBR_g4080 [Chara braunii]|uniref:Ubiquitin-like protease family profile domain-containing protein n=1 Tax=Chara braunii TaxID=69332 RepID=A0A388KHA7_CHABU|nr:hypothetical protein CBR_g4080 [Chara braunii]|eukprot:GBG69387.1 hypothetical protein CBR_g4080 [Chara braunii]